MRLTSILLLCFCTQSIFAQNLKGQIDSIAAVHFKDTTNVGLAIGIIANGSTSTNYYGGKYTKHTNDIDSTSLFEIGSVTKLYTSFILASLHNEKKLSLFDPLSKYLPRYVIDKKKWASQIRLVDLATHTSGLPGFDNTRSLKSLKGFDENNPYGLFTENFILDILKNTDTLINYEKVAYSNFGIGVLAYAMAKAENTTFESLFKKYITDRLRLGSTYLRIGEQQLTDLAIPHRKSEVVPLIQLAALSPSGSIKTTMPDLLKFLNLHIQKPDKLKNVVDMVLTNHSKDKDQAVGLGWGIYKIKNETEYFHTGGTYGSSSIVIMVPSKNLAVAILANNSSGNELTSYALKIVDKLIE